MDNPYKAPTGPLVSTFAFFIIIITILYSLFLFFQSYNLKRSIQNINDEQKSIDQELTLLRNEQVQALYNAQVLHNKLESSGIKLSKLIKHLQDITPVTVFFNSYHVSKDGSLQLGGLGDNYGSVSDVIANIKKSELFSDVFVPTVNLGSTSGGQSVVSFSVQVNANLK